jgi:anion-transporting  ArsA/GET3 family ATPase
VRELLKESSILIVVGNGGVGKTTAAAALGLAAACQGLNTALITVDPSLRLREALGLQRLSAEPTRMDGRRLRSVGLDSSVRLSAMRLEIKGTWDAMVAKFIKDPESRRRIRDNPFYRSLSEQFAGAEAYAALEQLEQLQDSGKFDLAIVDTPPAAHALAFLETPRSLLQLLDLPATRWLFAKQVSPGHKALSLANRAANFVITQIEAFTGTATLSAISDFFYAAAEALGALTERFRRAEAMLRSGRTNFVLVTTAEDSRLRDAEELLRLAKERHLNLRTVILNRLADELTFEALRYPRRKPVAHLTEITRMRELLACDNSDGSGLITYLERYREHQIRLLERAARFVRNLPPEVQVAAMPTIEMGGPQLRSLANLSRLLVGLPGRKILRHAEHLF